MATTFDEGTLDEPGPTSRATRLAVERRRRRRNLLFAAGLLGLIAAWSATLRPQSIGGPAGYVMVRGTSMLGTYNPGTLVVVREKPSYSQGEIVAYHIPDGQVGAGIIVIHRITGGSATAGFITQGDNNPSPDDWRPKPRDIVGKAWIAVPALGQMLAFLHAPVPLAALGASLAIVFVIEPGKKRSRPRGRRSAVSSC
jgi:signal peptidase